MKHPKLHKATGKFKGSVVELNRDVSHFPHKENMHRGLSITCKKFKAPLAVKMWKSYEQQPKSADSLKPPTTTSCLDP